MLALWNQDKHAHAPIDLLSHPNNTGQPSFPGVEESVGKPLGLIPFSDQEAELFASEKGLNTDSYSSHNPSSANGLPSLNGSRSRGATGGTVGTPVGRASRPGQPTSIGLNGSASRGERHITGIQGGVLGSSVPTALGSRRTRSDVSTMLEGASNLAINIVRIAHASGGWQMVGR